MLSAKAQYASESQKDEGGCMIQEFLEVFLGILKVLRELLALIRDKKNTRHNPTKD